MFPPACPADYPTPLPQKHAGSDGAENAGAPYARHLWLQLLLAAQSKAGIMRPASRIALALKRLTDGP
jgi:hypothetical protein